MPKKKYYYYRSGDTAKKRNKVIIEICEMRHSYDLPCRGCQYHGYSECPEAPDGSKSVSNLIRALHVQESLRESRRRKADKEVQEGKVRRVNPEYVDTFDGIHGRLDGKPI
jgi:hypothetical protein